MKKEELERLKELGSFLGSRDVRFVETALPTLLREREQLLGALRAVEWRGEGGFWESAACPSCGAEQLKNWERGDWHEADCALRAAIAAAES